MSAGVITVLNFSVQIDVIDIILRHASAFVRDA